jgi:hypothetical protein
MIRKIILGLVIWSSINSGDSYSQIPPDKGKIKKIKVTALEFTALTYMHIKPEDISEVATYKKTIKSANFEAIQAQLGKADTYVGNLGDVRMKCVIYYSGCKKEELYLARDRTCEIEGTRFKVSEELFRNLVSLLPENYKPF